MSDFLLELGFEEIPPSQLQPVVEYIQSSFLNLMKSTALSYSALKVSSTPRRFFLLASSVQEKQEDLQVKKIGPAKKVAYDEQGNLTAAALGFLKKNHSKPEDLYIETTDKGEFIALNYVQMGKATPDILKDWIYELIPHLPFTKTMIWNESRMALARPLRWLCILWNEEIIPLEIAGVKSGNITFGNRYLGLNRPVKIDSPSVYLSTLQENAVLAERAYRKEKIIEQLDGLPLENGLQIIPDKQLIETVTDLVEYPTAVSASFQEKYLFLPDKIITSTISQNQKCFSVQTKDGKLSNKFIFISNGNPDFSEVIRKGNEKVVDARLADAL
ncbi:MAG: glycine--tRNA ligase subunit beta, partial [Candidatus Cloacimonetes bacterium]|nr:glycine--tRNA ligase subunit beta [Candidatus Cloacimonadota bacterium]